MEITVSKFELLKELTATQGVVERKTTIPILSNFLFEAAGDTLTITATDLDLSLRTSCPATVKKEGSCTIPARQLYEYVKLLGDGDISIKLLENHWVNIRAGRSNTQDGWHGARELSFGAQLSSSWRGENSRCCALQHDEQDDLRHQQRGEPLHAEWCAAGAEAGVDRHGSDRRPSPGAYRQRGRHA